MLNQSIATITFCLVLSLHTTARGQDASIDDAEHNWPQWRGPLATGVAPHGNPPLEWSENKNIKWKLAIPGRGHSTPVIWGDHIFLTTAIPYGEPMEPKPQQAPGAHDNAPVTNRWKFVVMAISRKKGRVLWQKTVSDELPHEGGHTSGSLASNSPMTDGKYVYAFFGSRGLYCFDFDGKPIWEKTLGIKNTKHAHGEGSTPVLHGNTLVINWDHEGESFALALNKKTGEQIWKVKRDESTSC